MATKRKRRKDGRFRASIFMGYDSSGNELREYVYGYTESELEKNLFELKMKIARKEFIKEDEVTVAQWGDTWLKTYKSGKEYKTYQMYDITLRNHIIRELGHIRLVDLKPYHIQGLINNRYRQGLTKTLKNIKLTIKQMLDQAVENELIIKNPANRIELPASNKNERRALTNEEIEIIKKAPLSLKQRTFVYLCLYAGLRRGEAIALSKADIKKDIISVNKDLIFKKGIPEIKNRPKTDAGFRKIPVTVELKPVLDEYIKTVKGIYLFEPETHPGLMTETAYRSMWSSTWTKCNRAAGGKHDVIAFSKDITPHTLRHSFATMLYYAGVDIKQAQYLLGHASVEVTLNIYTHLKNEESAPTEKINSYLSGSNRGQNASSQTL